LTSGRRPAKGLRLSVLRGRFAVVRLAARAPLPGWASSGSFVSVTRTGTELSIVCRERTVPAGVRREVGFRCLEVEGPFEFDAVGVLASLAAPLALARIPILALSTFDTDYLLVRELHLAAALRALRRAGHVVSGAVE
jgi:hypothetical protein